jgi:hypothetical protein
LSAPAKKSEKYSRMDEEYPPPTKEEVQERLAIKRG